MTFPREYPLGVPAAQVISSQNFENWDIRISKAVDGVDGGAYSGAVELTNALLSGTSAVNTDGNIATTGDVECANVIVSQTASIEDMSATNALVDIAQIETCSVERMTCKTAGTQAIDTSSATVLALNFITRDTWIITLTNVSDPTAPAILSTVATLVDTDANADLRVKTGSKLSVLFIAGATQTGGIGISHTATVLPSSFRGLTKSDLIGPRGCGPISIGTARGLGGEHDWMRLDLVNVGTPTVPKYECTMSMGSGT